MADVHRPPSSEEGECTDGSAEADEKGAAPNSPDYDPKSPDYAPVTSPPKSKKDETANRVSSAEGSDSEGEKKKKHHKHHKEKKKHDDADTHDREMKLRQKLLQHHRERSSGSADKTTKKKDKEKEKDRPEDKEKAKVKKEKEVKREKGDKEADAASGDDEAELFSVQPKSQSKHKPIIWEDKAKEERIRGGEMRDRPASKDRTERERLERTERDVRRRDEPPIVRDHRRGERGGREWHGERGGRHREERGRRERERVDKEPKERERERDKKGKERERDTKRDDREKEKERKKGKRSRSRSSSVERDAKRERRSSSKPPAGNKEDDDTVKEAKAESETDKTPNQQELIEVDAAMEVDENKGSKGTPEGQQKSRRPGYSKFDSESEPEEMLTPERSPVPLRESDVEEEDDDFDPALVPFDELTDEQKARLSPDSLTTLERNWQLTLRRALPVYYAGILGCRKVREYDCMNRIEEGTFGVVYRAKCKRTEEVVALKALKMEKERDGFPITSLREINMLLKAGGHENIVKVREIVIGDNMDKIFLVMDFIEHDMKSLMDTMYHKGKKFTVGQVKTLLLQLLSGIRHLHELWILHRDLKTSNLLLTHKGQLKIADFGLAREYGDPLAHYTDVVVTLWYRAPELLLGTQRYSTPIDMWSVGCIMAEFIRLKPLFPGKGELDELNKIFLELGTPRADKWPGLEELHGWKTMKFEKHPFNQLRKRFAAEDVNDTAFTLLNKMLTYDPSRRATAEEAMLSPWFKEEPLPTPRELFPTFPAKSEQGKAPPMKPVAVKPKAELAFDARTKELLAQLDVPKHHLKERLAFDAAKF